LGVFSDPAYGNRRRAPDGLVNISSSC
jgi:hypothetical protein